MVVVRMSRGPLEQQSTHTIREPPIMFHVLLELLVNLSFKSEIGGHIIGNIALLNYLPKFR